MAEVQIPVVHALLLCDSIYRDPTGKTAVVGLFNGIKSHTFPATHTHLSVFVSARAPAKTFEASLQFVSPEGKPIVDMANKFDVPRSGARVMDMHFGIENVQFPIPGTYLVRFSVDGKLMAERPLTLSLASETPQ